MSEVITSLSALSATLRSRDTMPAGKASTEFDCGEPLERFYLKPKHYEEFKAAMHRKERIFIHGLNGCGKSEIFAQICAEEGWKFKRFPLFGDTSKEDMLGTIEVRDGTTSFKDGIIPWAMKNGVVLALEEVDIAQPEVLAIIQILLERNTDGGFKPLYNPLNGETVLPAPGFMVITTANTNGKGDTTGIFPATHPLNEAFLDRFSLVDHFTYPEASVEVEIIRRQTGLAKELATKVVQLANSVREAFQHQKVYCTFSLRRTRSLAEKLKAGTPLALAMRWAVTARVSEEDSRAVMEIAGRLWGSSALSE